MSCLGAEGDCVQLQVKAEISWQKQAELLRIREWNIKGSILKTY